MGKCKSHLNREDVGGWGSAQYNPMQLSWWFHSWKTLAAEPPEHWNPASFSMDVFSLICLSQYLRELYTLSSFCIVPLQSLGLFRHLGLLNPAGISLKPPTPTPSYWSYFTLRCSC